ncbi:hypothetical protein BAUCODRAFT_26333 [Baudoinia panamericana UAMH 10762]|uniref:Uncharacterized protein n=1 Tax=Baudoinia panamericana (strain UAMH 10762) TaxID=717646 RepID=M2N5T9_BAUPA|nr:uncharacterized protein BAUCODRAFT_26333 [Baudoinia panamericana UAMH 10762]EMC94135.1 hypothetical protein BAUCODRAFT_26333 [Baudoinia panamericana UAMH 10762]
MESKPSLNALSPELIATISENCDNATLRNLRHADSLPIIFGLVNRPLSAASLDAFGKRFSAKRSHLFSDFGLRALVDIAASPHLARHIKHVELVTQQLTQETATSPSPRNALITRSPWSITLEKGRRLDSAAVEAAWGPWLDEEGLLNTAVPVSLLSTAFATLAPHRDSFRVTMDVREGPINRGRLRRAYGQATLCQQLGKDASCLRMDDIGTNHEDTVTAVAKAIEQTSFPVADPAFRAIAVLPELHQAGIGHHSSPAWSAVDTLQLNLTKDGAFGSACASTAPEQWMAAMSGLRYLMLRCSYSFGGMNPHDRKLERLGKALQLTPVCQLWLDFVMVPGSQVIKLLAPITSQIMDLRISDSTLQSDYDWQTTMRYIANNLGLDRLELKDISSVDSEWSWAGMGPYLRFGPHFESEHIVVHKAEEVKRALCDLATVHSQHKSLKTSKRATAWRLGQYRRSINWPMERRSSR